VKQEYVFFLFPSPRQEEQSAQRLLDCTDYRYINKKKTEKEKNQRAIRIPRCRLGIRRA